MDRSQAFQPTIELRELFLGSKRVAWILGAVRTSEPDCKEC